MPKRIAFMGSDPIALPMLDLLWDNQQAGDYEFMGVISQPDRPTGRGKKIQPNAISSWALEKNLPLFRPEKPSDQEYDWLANEHIDLVIVMAYGHIIKKRFLELPPLGMVNLHGSLLPKYRGATPLEAAIASGDTRTGVSLMDIAPKMDTGGVMDTQSISIRPEDTSSSIRNAAAQACIPLIERNLPKLLAGQSHFIPQDETLVTYTRKISKADGWLNFNSSAHELVNRIRAMSPWPGGYFKLEGDLTLKIGLAKAIDDPSGQPGTIIKADSSGILIGTASGALRILELQRPGGRMLPVDDFLRGFDLPTGTQVIGGEGVPLVSPEPFPYKKYC